MRRFCKSWRILLMLVCTGMVMTMLVSCRNGRNKDIDFINSKAYEYHYKNLDSTAFYANKAQQEAEVKGDGDAIAEALNNKAFVAIAKMQYPSAYQMLDSVKAFTDNQVELLISDVQLMRLCQRESRNKDFYTHKEQASRRIKRIGEELDALSPRLKDRMRYAMSEFDIVVSTYYYYVGLEKQSVEAIQHIDQDELIEKDTAQYLNYLYNVGAGGIITQGSQQQIYQEEFDYLMRCFMLAKRYGYPFWEANSLQALSEHLQEDGVRDTLLANNRPAVKFFNTDNMPDTLIAGNLAERSLALFEKYGDVYQTAGAYRTLAQCYWQIGDYHSSLACLKDALTKDSAIFAAPDLVASIREQMSVVFSAMNDKPNSDVNRNLYLDKQEQTRQDKYLESRAEQLDITLQQLNYMIWAVVGMILLAAILLFLFDYMRRKGNRNNSLDDLLLPLQQWKADHANREKMSEEEYEETMEQKAVSEIHLVSSKRQNMEQRAKLSLLHGMMPIIDRMIHEIDRLKNTHETEQVRKERYMYVAELTDSINDYNAMLTQWIQLRQGQLSLRIESFPVQMLFNMVARSRVGFQIKGIQLEVEPTDTVVKADRTLTLFMLNTMADNARKFTPKGGKVRLEAKEGEGFVELSVTDTGKGMTADEMDMAFHVEKKIADNTMVQKTDGTAPDIQEQGHGFGLLNCKGIIDKYKKISAIFQVCDIGVQSEKGKGSRFFFRLPKGVVRKVLTLIWAMSASCAAWTQQLTPELERAAQYADSCYHSNIMGNFQQTLLFADKARECLNKHLLHRLDMKRDTMVAVGDVKLTPPEIQWFHDSVSTNYDVILDIRNESAVAALALHMWDTYKYNNKVYTQLFKEKSADNTLESYCKTMERSKNNRYIAVGLLMMILLVIIIAYFALYYRHRVYYRFCLERVKLINETLLSKDDETQKLMTIQSYEKNFDKLPENMQAIVAQITDELKRGIAASKKSRDNIEMAEDELRRVRMEQEKLHVCNSVLDNCLSTLKHETMYYPSRIKMLVGGGDDNLQAMSELAHYYKELFGLLTMQATRQMEAVKMSAAAVGLADVLPSENVQAFEGCHVMGDKDMLRFLFDILAKENGTKQLPVTMEQAQQSIELHVLLDRLHYDQATCESLFVPKNMQAMPFLLCRQIIRDLGEATNQRGYGISVAPTEDGTMVSITLPKAKAPKPII